MNDILITENWVTDIYFEKQDKHAINAINNINLVIEFIEANSTMKVCGVDGSNRSDSVYVKFTSKDPREYDYIIRFSDHDCDGRPYGFVYNFIEENGDFAIDKSLLEIIIKKSIEVDEKYKQDKIRWDD